MKAYRTVKVSDRRYLIAREGFDGILHSVATCNSEHAAKDLTGALNASPQPEAVSVIEFDARGAMRTKSPIHGVR